MKVTPGEALGAQLAATAVQAALVAFQAGGYPKPSAEQARALSHRLVQEALAVGLILVDDPNPPTDEELDRAAEASGWAAVREVLGPAPLGQ